MKCLINGDIYILFVATLAISHIYKPFNLRSISYREIVRGIIYKTVLLQSHVTCFRSQRILPFALDYNEDYCHASHVEIRSTVDWEIPNLDFEIKGMGGEGVGHILSEQLRGFKESRYRTTKRSRYYKPVVDSRSYRFYRVPSLSVVSTYEL